MANKRASLNDRVSKRAAAKKGRGVDALFEPEATSQEVSALETAAAPPSSDQPQDAETTTDKKSKKVPSTATFNLYPWHQDFLDIFVQSKKLEFRHKPNVGVGAINKSAVLQELVDLLKEDESLQKKVVRKLEQKYKLEGSRHDPRRRRS